MLKATVNPIPKFFRRLPFLTLNQALLLLRVGVAVLFMAHATVRVVNGSIPGFGGFLETRGWPQGVALVWMITVWEIGAGLCMAVGRCVRLCAAGLGFICFMGIVIIHAKLGWFVGEHGVGGVEYSLCLLMALTVIAAADRHRPAAA